MNDKNKERIFNPDGISPMVIRRMPRYLRYIRELNNNGVARISSQALSKMMDVTASQIRQDFNCFGGFGQQGYGYNVEYLYKKMVDILCLNKGYKLIMLGAGNLGKALMHSPMFGKAGVTPVAMFDIDPRIVGHEVAGVPVYPIEYVEKFLAENHVDIAVLTLPRMAAPKMAQKLHACGIVAIWNFTNADLGLDRYGTIVESVHISDSLMTLTYRLGFHEKKKQEKEAKQNKLHTEN